MFNRDTRTENKNINLGKIISKLDWNFKSKVFSLLLHSLLNILNLKLINDCISQVNIFVYVHFWIAQDFKSATELTG